MKSFVFVLLITVMTVACSRDKQNQSANDRTSTNVAADNSGRNARDRDGATKTSGDQSENEADRALTQKIRQAITSDEALSTNGKNVDYRERWQGDAARAGEKRNGESRYRS